jgi:hypothetical protein
MKGPPVLRLLSQSRGGMGGGERELREVLFLFLILRLSHASANGNISSSQSSPRKAFIWTRSPGPLRCRSVRQVQECETGAGVWDRCRSVRQECEAGVWDRCRSVRQVQEDQVSFGTLYCTALHLVTSLSWLHPKWFPIPYIVHYFRPESYSLYSALL